MTSTTTYPAVSIPAQVWSVTDLTRGSAEYVIFSRIFGAVLRALRADFIAHGKTYSTDQSRLAMHRVAAYRVTCTDELTVALNTIFDLLVAEAQSGLPDTVPTDQPTSDVTSSVFEQYHYLDADKLFIGVMQTCDTQLLALHSSFSMIDMFHDLYIAMRSGFGANGTNYPTDKYYQAAREALTDAVKSTGAEEDMFIRCVECVSDQIMDHLVEAAKTGLPEIPEECGNQVYYTDNTGRRCGRFTLTQAEKCLKVIDPAPAGSESAVCTDVAGQKYITVAFD
jgi:hypothetical protein